jgi:MFS family permease
MKRGVVVGALGTAQTLAWGSSYYLPAILADPIASGLHLSRTGVFGAFSGALLLSAVLGPAVGRAIDAHGGRGVLALSNLVLAAGLILLAFTRGVVSLAAAWSVLGVGMAMGLYDPAFAYAGGPLRPCGARADHWHHPDRRIRQHGRVATLGIA